MKKVFGRKLVGLFVLVILSAGIFVGVANFDRVRNLLSRAAESKGQTYALRASGFAPGEKVSVWANLSDGRTVAVRGRTADQTGLAKIWADSRFYN